MDSEKSEKKINPNLKLFQAGENDWRTPEQRHINAMKGAAASAEARRKRKKLTEAAKWLLAEKDIISNGDIQKKLKELGITDATNAEALMLIALKLASKGSVDAMKFVRDTGGESPNQRVELAGDPDRPIATMDLRQMSEADLLRLAERKGISEGPME